MLGLWDACSRSIMPINALMLSEYAGKGGIFMEHVSTSLRWAGAQTRLVLHIHDGERTMLLERRCVVAQLVQKDAKRPNVCQGPSARWRQRQSALETHQSFRPCHGAGRRRRAQEGGTGGLSFG